MSEVDLKESSRSRTLPTLPWFPLLAILILMIPVLAWDWEAGRNCLRALGISWLSTVIFLAVNQPELLRRRHLGPEHGPLPPDWDARFLGHLRLWILLLLAVAGWQSGRGGVPYDPGVFHFGVGLLLSGTLVLWASCFSNPFFETQVRHQSEQGHHVVKTGLYRAVRHPGYLAMILMVVGMPIMLHSSAAGLPACVCVAILVTRLQREESHLRAHLPGYAAYTELVRFRLIPYLW